MDGVFVQLLYSAGEVSPPSKKPNLFIRNTTKSMTRPRIKSVYFSIHAGNLIPALSICTFSSAKTSAFFFSPCLGSSCLISARPAKGTTNPATTISARMNLTNPIDNPPLFAVVLACAHHLHKPACSGTDLVKPLAVHHLGSSCLVVTPGEGGDHFPKAPEARGPQVVPHVDDYLLADRVKRLEPVEILEILDCILNVS